MAASIQRFLSSPPFAVVGASSNRAKFGNRVLRCYQSHGLPAFAINPRTAAQGGEIEGLPALASLSDCPELPGAVSLITPPAVSLLVLEQALELGIGHLWLQPGAEDAAVLARVAELDQQSELQVIHSGPCLLVELGC